MINIKNIKILTMFFVFCFAFSITLTSKAQDGPEDPTKEFVPDHETSKKILREMAKTKPGLKSLLEDLEKEKPPTLDPEKILGERDSEDAEDSSEETDKKCLIVLSPDYQILRSLPVNIAETNFIGDIIFLQDSIADMSTNIMYATGDWEGLTSGEREVISRWNKRDRGYIESHPHRAEIERRIADNLLTAFPSAKDLIERYIDELRAHGKADARYEGTPEQLIEAIRAYQRNLNNSGDDEDFNSEFSLPPGIATNNGKWITLPIPEDLKGGWIETVTAAKQTERTLINNRDPYTDEGFVEGMSIIPIDTSGEKLIPSPIPGEMDRILMLYREDRPDIFYARLSSGEIREESQDYNIIDFQMREQMRITVQVMMLMHLEMEYLKGLLGPNETCVDTETVGKCTLALAASVGSTLLIRAACLAAL